MKLGAWVKMYQEHDGGMIAQRFVLMVAMEITFVC